MWLCSYICRFCVKDPEPLFRSPTSDIDFIRVVEQRRTKTNNVKQRRTSDIDFVRPGSTLFDSDKSQTRSIKVEQGRTESISLVGGTSFFKSSYPILCKMLIGHFISTFCSTFAKSVQDVH